jgi:hypothetical protein
MIKRKKRSVIISQMEKGYTRIYGTTKSLDKSHIMPEESEDLENTVSHLKNQINDMNGSMLKLVDL